MPWWALILSSSLVWGLQQRALFPVGTRFYPFGNRHVVSDDGWQAVAGGRLDAGAGHLVLSGERGVVNLISPPLDILAGGEWIAPEVDLELAEGQAIQWLVNGEPLELPFFVPARREGGVATKRSWWEFCRMGAAANCFIAC